MSTADSVNEARARLSPHLRANLQRADIDIDLTLQILANWNAGAYNHYQPLQVASLPTIDNRTIIDRRSPQTLELTATEAERAIARLGHIVPTISRFGTRNGTRAGVRFDPQALHQLGVALYPRVAYGVLNGGSATSYADHKKNSSLDATLFGQLQPTFERLATLCHGRPKGLTPALLQPDGTAGPSFLELKMRNLLLEALRWQQTNNGAGAHGGAAGGDQPLLPLFPMFQMSSSGNQDELAAAYTRFASSPALHDLIAHSGIEIQHVIGAPQPLLAAYSHSEDGTPKRIFDRAGGRPNTPLGLPGGHGQNFLILRDIYRSLYAMGKRYVYLGNVDNLGCTIDPVGLAWLALSGRPAAFEFSFRTAVDVKGGVLIRDRSGRLACGDIGVAIGADELHAAASGGQAVLFNCAVGLFDLEWLTTMLDSIIANLPVRFGDQDKDAGRYSQAEQVTWEIIAMLEECLIFAVDKHTRFLAAKLLLEMLLTSGATPDKLPPGATNHTAQLLVVGQRLHAGLVAQLQQAYGYRHNGTRWVEIAARELLF